MHCVLYISSAGYYTRCIVYCIHISSSWKLYKVHCVLYSTYISSSWKSYKVHCVLCIYPPAGNHTKCIVYCIYPPAGYYSIPNILCRYCVYILQLGIIPSILCTVLILRWVLYPVQYMYCVLYCIFHAAGYYTQFMVYCTQCTVYSTYPPAVN